MVTSTFTDQSGVPAWQTIPSWDVVGTADHIITPAEQLFMANRAHAHITEINALHLSMITDPGLWPALSSRQPRSPADVSTSLGPAAG